MAQDYFALATSIARAQAAPYQPTPSDDMRHHLRAVLDLIGTDSRYDECAILMSARAALAKAAQPTVARRHKLPKGECSYCDQEATEYHPSHDASDRCESGKRSHCTCDTCF